MRREDLPNISALPAHPLRSKSDEEMSGYPGSFRGKLLSVYLDEKVHTCALFKTCSTGED